MKTPPQKAAKVAANTEPQGLPPSTGVPEKSGVHVKPIHYVNVNLLEPAPWNPMEDNPKSFNALVENIRESGMTDNIIAVPLTENYKPPAPGSEVMEGKFRIISGHDRWKAAITVGLQFIPTVIALDWDEDVQKFQTVRHNVIQKKINPLKFFNLFNELSKKYSEDVTKSMMMFTDQGELDSLLKRVRSGMPDSMKGELDKKKKEIKTVDDLTTVVSEIFNRCGTNLDRGYLVFSFGGQQHVYVSMSKELQAEVQKLMDKSELESRHISDIFMELFDTKEFAPS